MRGIKAHIRYSTMLGYGPFLIYKRLEDKLMTDKPTYEELERRGKELEKKPTSIRRQMVYSIKVSKNIRIFLVA